MPTGKVLFRWVIKTSVKTCTVISIGCVFAQRAINKISWAQVMKKKKICLNNFLRNKLFKGDSSTNKPKKKDARILGVNLAQRCICAVLSVIQRQGGANMKNTNSSCLIS